MLGTKIKQYRATHNLSQKEMAKLVGTSQVYLGNIERGARTPSQAMETKIQRALDRQERGQTVGVIREKSSRNIKAAISTIRLALDVLEREIS
jgi:transcriptional regulator with XRE-family HTH domain